MKENVTFKFYLGNYLSNFKKSEKLGHDFILKCDLQICTLLMLFLFIALKYLEFQNLLVGRKCLPLSFQTEK